MEYSEEEAIKHDLHHLSDYQAFADKYGITDLVTFVRTYDIYELTAFMPPAPTPTEKTIFAELIGVNAESGYMDFARSNNTFELMMQWQERTNNLDLGRLDYQTA
jgi:hypothetical protein